MAWDDEKQEKVVAMYLEAEPTAENSAEIVNEIAEEVDESPNGVRRILSLKEVYIKKEVTASTKTSTGGTRVSKAAAVEALTAAIQDAGQEVDEDIVGKLTGKAAQYFTGIINAVNE